MLKNNDGTDKLLSRIQALAGAVVLGLGLIGGYAKYCVDIAESRTDAKAQIAALQYQVSEERRTRAEETSAVRNDIKELAGAVRADHDAIMQSVAEQRRITRWLDNSPGGTGKGN